MEMAIGPAYRGLDYIVKSCEQDVARHLDAPPDWWSRAFEGYLELVDPGCRPLLFVRRIHDWLPVFCPAIVGGSTGESQSGVSGYRSGVPNFRCSHALSGALIGYGLKPAGR